MKERPILFSGEMVKAILEGRKTQTRRVVKIQPCDGWHPEVGIYAPTCIDRHGEEYPGAEVFGASDENEGRVCPYGQPGDRLWVRETLRRDPKANIWYYAAGKPEDWVVVAPENHTESLVWAHHKEGDVCVSIHMPRWASRITLEITDVKVERVKNISEQDARDEGAGISLCEYPQWDGDPNCYRMLFRERWNNLNAKRGFGWEKNPWVWVLEFKRVEAAA